MKCAISVLEQFIEFCWTEVHKLASSTGTRCDPYNSSLPHCIHVITEYTSLHSLNIQITRSVCRAATVTRTENELAVVFLEGLRRSIGPRIVRYSPIYEFLDLIRLPVEDFNVASVLHLTVVGFYVSPSTCSPTAALSASVETNRLTMQRQVTLSKWSLRDVYLNDKTKFIRRYQSSGAYTLRTVIVLSRQTPLTFSNEGLFRPMASSVRSCWSRENWHHCWVCAW